MKREDFKEITDEHFEICEEIIKKDGDCSKVDVSCSDCPFSQINATNGESCNWTPSFEKTLENAKEFLKFREETQKTESMKREDFKEIKDEHFEFCEKMIDDKGRCLAVCCNCPFSPSNLVVDGSCGSAWYGNSGVIPDKKDEVLVKSAKEFLKFKPSKSGDIGENQDVVCEPVSDYKKAKHDAVNKPNHYQLEVNGQNLEVKDLIKAVVKDMDGVKGYYVGNVIKYIMRAEKKNGIEDYKKAKKYLEFIIDEVEEWK